MMKGGADMDERDRNTASNEENEQEKTFVPDFSELWKEMYFKTETVWAKAFEEFIRTKSFVNMMDNTLAQYLSNEKNTRKFMEKYFESSPVPTKKDVARVAELVISLEEKIESIETKSIAALQSMAESLLKMADYQQEIKKEILELSKRQQIMQKRLDTVSNLPAVASGTKMTAVSVEKKTAKNKPAKQKTKSDEM